MASRLTQDQGEALGIRRKRLSREIDDYKASLHNYGTQRPHDPPGEAHTKAYLAVLERLDKELADEWKQKVEGLNPKDI
jgi:hypothetical protein